MPTDVARPFMVRWVVGSILHPVCGMVHIKSSLLLIEKSS